MSSMKHIMLIQLVYAITVSLPDVHGTIITGPNTNMSAIMWKAWLKGSGQMMNRLPPTHYNDNWRWREVGQDAAVGRRFLKHIIAAVREGISNEDMPYGQKMIQENDGVDSLLGTKGFQDAFDSQTLHNGEESVGIKSHPDKTSKDFEIYDFTDYEEEPAFNKIPIQANDDDTNMLRSKINKEKENAQVKLQEQAHAELIHRQHDERVKEIVNFMQDNLLSTQYLHEEVRRIKRTRVPKDMLRRMVEYLEQPGMENLKNSVVKCFLNKRKLYKRPVDVWKNRLTNNLAINIIKDPYNFGFVN